MTCHSGIYLLFLDLFCLQINETKAKKKIFFLKYSIISNRVWAKPDCVSAFPQTAERFVENSHLKIKNLLCVLASSRHTPRPRSRSASVHWERTAWASGVPVSGSPECLTPPSRPLLPARASYWRQFPFPLQPFCLHLQGPPCCFNALFLRMWSRCLGSVTSSYCSLS